jgi:6-phosphogluconate dehydrogenase
MHKVIYIMGVSGSGKTTIGKLLSKKMNCPFFDADDFHSIANIEKLKGGIPLTDNDRAAWLESLNKLALKEVVQHNVIIACSGLKKSYRQVLTKELTNFFCFFLHGDYNVIYNRIQNRKNHFMPTSLLQSQFETLELSSNDYAIDINNDPDEIVEIILQFVHSF